MEDRSSETGVDFRDSIEKFDEIINAARAAGSNYGNRYRVANYLEQREVNSAFYAVGVDAVDHQFSGA